MAGAGDLATVVPSPRGIRLRKALLSGIAGAIAGFLSADTWLASRRRPAKPDLDSLRDTFQNAAEGFYRMAPDGRILWANAAFAKLAGFDSPASLMRSGADMRRTFYDDPDRRSVFEAKLCATRSPHRYEARVRQRSGEVMWVLESARAVRDATGQVAYFEGFLQDITRRYHTMEALRESQQLLNRTFHSLRDAILIVNAETREILDCNPSSTKLFGYERDELAGHSTRVLHVDEAAFFEFKELVTAGIRENGYSDLPSFPMKRKNGEVFLSQYTVVPLYGEEGALVSWVSVIRDITEQKRAEDKLELYRRKLRALAAELTIVEARERRAIAAQLHENLGQMLATCKMKVAALRTIPLAATTPAAIAEIQGLVEEALQQTRSLTYQLSPPILYQLGIEAAVKWLAETMEKQHGFRVSFTRQGESGQLDEESSVFLFSAVRELLLNVAKHAHADRVAVRLRWFDSRVSMLVRDNGKGFQRAHGVFPESHDGFGLFNIQERVFDLGGQLLVHTEPGRGAAVRIALPLTASERIAEGPTWP